MNEWLGKLGAALAAKAVPLLAALALAALAAAGLIESERAALARCVLLEAAPRQCVSSLSASPLAQLLGPSAQRAS